MILPVLGCFPLGPTRHDCNCNTYYNNHTIYGEDFDRQQSRIRLLDSRYAQIISILMQLSAIIQTAGVIDVLVKLTRGPLVQPSSPNFTLLIKKKDITLLSFSKSRSYEAPIFEINVVELKVVSFVENVQRSVP